MNKNFKNILNILFLGIFLILFFRYIKNNEEILLLLFGLKFYKVFILLLLNFINYLIKAQINVYLFSYENIKLHFHEALDLVTKSTAANLFGPVNIGSGYKMLYLKNKYNLNFTNYISINTAYSFYLNYLYLVILLILLAHNSFSNILKSQFIFILILLVLISLSFVFVYKFSRKFIYKNNKINSFLNNLFLGFKLIKRNKVTSLKLFTFSIILLTFSIYYFDRIMNTLQFDISIVSVISFLCISNIANLIKITPGNIGYLEVTLISLQELHNIQASLIILFGIVGRFISGLGLIFYFFISKVLKF